MKLKLCLAAVLCVCSNLVFAETLAEALNKCSQVDNSLKRLVCYDKLNQQAKGYEDSELPTHITRQGNYPSNAPSQAPVNVASNSSASAEDNFGLPILQVVKQTQNQVDSLSGQVKEVKKTRRGKLVITLGNGQVWTQTDTASMLIKVGDSVNIEKGLLGAFFLKTSSGKTRIKVKRSS